MNIGSKGMKNFLRNISTIFAVSLDNLFALFSIIGWLMQARIKENKRTILFGTGLGIDNAHNGDIPTSALGA